MTAATAAPLDGEFDAQLARSAPATSLVDLLDRLLGTGVVLCGDLTISLAGVDLVMIRLRALISTVRAEMEPHLAAGAP